MKLNKIFLLAGIALAGVFAACSDDDDYEKGPVASGNQFQTVTFGEDNTFSAELDPADPTTYTITVYRDSAHMDQAATIPLKVLINTDSVFVVPANVSFAAGEAETQFTVTYDKAEIGSPYTLEVAIGDDSYINPYSAATYTSYVLNIQRVKWNKIGLGTFNDTFLNQVAYYVEIEQRDDIPTKFRILQPYAGANADPDNWDGALVGSEDIIFFEIFPKEADVDDDGDTYCPVSFDTWVTGYWYDADNVVIAFRPSDLGQSGDEESVYYPDYNTIYLVPYYYMPGLGGWGLKTVVVTLPDGTAPEGAQAGDLVPEPEEEEGDEGEGGEGEGEE